MGASDGVLANLGAGAIAGDRMVITIGTSCAVRAGRSTPFTDGATQSFCYVLDANHFIVGGPSNSGGDVLDWLAHQLAAGSGVAAVPIGPNISGASPAADTAVAVLIAAAESAEPGDLICVPYLAGERAPIWREDASGVFLGLRLRHTAADLMRAAIEGIILNAYVIAARMTAFDAPPRAIVATGHVLESRWIRQLVADVFGLPVRFLGAVDASATGAALLALMASGAWSLADYGTFQSRLPAEILQPTPNPRLTRQVDRFRRLTDALTGNLSDVYFDR
jgi:gluconokinase